MRTLILRNKILKHNLCILVVIVLVISSVGIAFATSTRSDTQYATVYSKNYQFYNTVTYLGSNGFRAFVNIRSDSGEVPTGYMGANAKLYVSDGKLSRSSGMTYNTKAMVANVIYSPTTPFTAMSYYARGTVEFYNGDGYTSYSVDRSPTLQRDDNRSLNCPISVEPYKTNMRGETYGSELYEMKTGIKPDLISAIGDNGVSGYVRNTDINPIHKNIEEALAYNNVTEIPVYEIDGVTIIDTFSLGHDFE